MPPFSTLIATILSEFFVLITGDNFAIGVKVLSDAYSNPIFKISVFSILLLVVDDGNNLAFIPWVEATLTNFGKDLYPEPPDIKLTLLIAPLSFLDVVVYFNTLVSNIW